MTRFRLSWPWWRCVLMGLIALALALSAYLSWHHLVGGSMIGCGGGSPCDRVLNSRWSSIGGVLPVSGLATGAYLALLVASLFIGPATDSPVRRLAWGAMLVLVGAAAGSAVWFIIVQKWAVGAFCPYCMTAHITGLLLAALVVWRAPRQFDDGPTKAAPEIAHPNVSKFATTSKFKHAMSQTRQTGSFRAFGFRISELGIRIWALPGLALAGIMAIGQIAFKPPPAYRAGESQSKAPAIDPHTVPLVGSPDAPYVVKLLFDYECPHCQQLHFMLNEAVRRFDGKMAFALCPTPLNTNCNPYIPRNVEQFKDSCDLAKVGLAVWVAQREALPAFDGWMFSFESGDRWQPRSLDAARAKAVELVGQAKFDAARTNTWIDWYLQASTRLFGDTGSNAVPKLVFGSRWVVPEPYDADGLVTILQDRLAVPRP
jgi:uncharacterized membrane protein/protein-disulfide isomerase